MCGVIGMFNVPNCFEETFMALHMQQHRGDEGAGVVFSLGDTFTPPAPHRTLGLVSDCAKAWPGKKLTEAFLSVGHLRYGTSGAHLALDNVQPFVVDSRYGKFCIAHNGDIPNYEGLRRSFQEQGAIFTSTSDTEVIARFIAEENAPSLKEAMGAALQKIHGAFSLVMATPSVLIAARDPWGYRPLVLGAKSGGYVVASETCALDAVRAHYVREIEPGELVWIDVSGVTSTMFARKPVTQKCVFEEIYFSRPDCVTFGIPVYEFRRALGRKLAKEYGKPKQDNFVITGVPDSGVFIAEGYARTFGLWTEPTLVRHHWVARTFIQSGDAARANGVRLKFNPIRNLVFGKTVVLIDDSIVRGTTMRRLVRMLKVNNACRVVVLVASPPIMHPCRYGIDMKTHDELLAAKKMGDVEVIRKYIEADDLYYLSLDGLREVVGEHYHGFCFSCFDGKYAI